MTLTDVELLQLFQSSENEQLERKRNADDPEKLRRAICAFANDLSNSRKLGYLIVGQNDDCTCENLPIDDALLKSIANWRDDGKFLPFPQMSVATHEIAGCRVAIVAVQPSDNPPIMYDRRIWVRVGPSTRRASQEEERRLVERRRSANLPFDAKVVDESSAADLDLLRFHEEYLPSAVALEVLEENGRSESEQLRALNMLSADGRATATGILILGKDPRRFFPGAYVQFRRVNGTELTDPILDHKEIGGTLGDQIQQLEELVDLNVRTASGVGPVARRDLPDYPKDAMRQLLRNAIAHRTYEATNAPVYVTWYSDRVEIQSPGGPFGQVTIENFSRGATDYRNPTIAGALKNLGYLERFGIGFGIARKALLANGNPDLAFELNAQHVLVVVRSAT